MTKQELINLIERLPDNIEIFNNTTELDDEFKVMDIRIFLTPQDEIFYKWYFGI